ncbi:MAG: Uncharacterized protein XD76_0402 [candidate division TA06 bacterium 32_111]|uniref:Uncharacterized protein n=2 Tax=Bacteria candidate phyla TaxID=1783234 RepID=A0A117M677_UNCT6|nr:MAG: Uncharacterized protein XD76_0402 [candidate division TA06 bacterium 32_111]KUK86587.1 MAG: Uncharacterized protein XE03_1376 [candidate division TA06 bacterium 34_109]HAF07874.1 hypothetical protein [candidate division WOR-3 bacterium]HCP17392.1 hypothetical protein [candidate division WOR-3 bacterium]
MKKIVIFIFLLTLSIISYSHSASEIKATFDFNSKMLYVTVEHSVKDVKSHYIKKIEIQINGKTIITQNYTKQQNENNQDAAYLITDALIGDKITINASCNILGTKKFTLLLNQPENNE